MLDEREFLSPFGIRSLSRVHLEHPYTVRLHGSENRMYAHHKLDSAFPGWREHYAGPFPAARVRMNFLWICRVRTGVRESYDAPSRRPVGAATPDGQEDGMRLPHARGQTRAGHNKLGFSPSRRRPSISPSTRPHRGELHA